MGTSDNITMIKGIYEAFSRGDVDHIVANVTDDVDWAAEAEGPVRPGTASVTAGTACASSSRTSRRR